MSLLSHHRQWSSHPTCAKSPCTLSDPWALQEVKDWLSNSVPLHCFLSSFNHCCCKIKFVTFPTVSDITIVHCWYETAVPWSPTSEERGASSLSHLILGRFNVHLFPQTLYLGHQQGPGWEYQCFIVSLISPLPLPVTAVMIFQIGMVVWSKCDRWITRSAVK